MLQDSPDLFEQSVEDSWLLSRECLTFVGAAWRAYFAAIGTDLPDAPERLAGASASRLFAIARSRGIRVTDLKVRKPDLAITFESVTEDVDVTDHEYVASIADEGDTTVHAATVDVGGRSLVVDLISGTASGHTSASFTLLEFGRAALPLLLHGDDAGHTQLDRTFAAPEATSGASEQPTLDGLS